MWTEIINKFKKYPAQLNVVTKILELGFKITENGEIYCDDVEIADVSLARAANVDRRTVKSTISTILENNELKEIFKNISPAGPSLKNIANYLGLGVIEIEASENNSGILTNISKIISKKGINIRQVYASDSNIETPNLIIITEPVVPNELISEFLKIDGVIKISIY